jgi:hypothetical protein
MYLTRWRGSITTSRKRHGASWAFILLRESAEAQAAAEKGSMGKIVLVA